MDEQRTTRRIRREIDERGLRASIAADFNVVVSTGSTGTSRMSTSRQDVRISQGRRRQPRNPDSHAGRAAGTSPEQTPTPKQEKP